VTAGVLAQPASYIELFDEILRDALLYPEVIATAIQHNRAFRLLDSRSDTALRESDNILMSWLSDL
jgi:hypothetical protein